MAYTAKTVEDIVRTGLAATYTAAPGTGAGNGFSIQNDGRTILHVKNVAAGGDCVVTIVTPNTVDGLALADRTVTVADGAERFIGPFPPSIYNESDGTIRVDFSEITNVTLAALRMAGV
ncbi:MAG: hypothetical protein AAB368_03430 [bacterium]